MLPEYKLPALVFRALLDIDGICDAPSEHTAKEIDSGKSNGNSLSNDSRQWVARILEQPRFA
jgi:hypothetical protein